MEPLKFFLDFSKYPHTNQLFDDLLLCSFNVSQFSPPKYWSSKQIASFRKLKASFQNIKEEKQKVLVHMVLQ